LFLAQGLQAELPEECLAAGCESKPVEEPVTTPKNSPKKNKLDLSKTPEKTETKARRIEKVGESKPVPFGLPPAPETNLKRASRTQTSKRKKADAEEEKPIKDKQEKTNQQTQEADPDRSLQVVSDEEDCDDSIICSTIWFWVETRSF